MRIVAAILGVLGAVGALFLGGKWLSDLNSELGKAAQAAAGTNPELASMKTASYVLLAVGIMGIIAVVMMFKKNTAKAVPAILLLVGGGLPRVFSTKAIFGTPMLLAGIFAFLAKPKDAE